MVLYSISTSSQYTEVCCVILLRIFRQIAQIEHFSYVNFRVLFLTCDGIRRGDPNDLEGGKNEHQSLFAYFERKPQTEGTSVTRELVSCILDGHGN